MEILWERRWMAVLRRAMAMLRASAFLKLMLTCHAKLCFIVRPGTIADSWSVFGSQARLFTRECVAWLMPLFTLGAEHHDQQTARLVALRWPLFYHAPSLVQHTGRVSTWGGGGFHTAGDFVEDWVPG